MSQQKELHWWSSPRTLLRTILMLDDTAHSIALGTAIGMFIAMTPTVGIQMILVMLVALLTSPFFQFNRVAALITVYVSNPITLVPIYWFDYKVGTLFIDDQAATWDFAGILQYNNFQEWWETIVKLFVDIGPPLIVGSLIVSTICGVVTYPIIRRLLRSARRDEPDQRDPEQQPVASAVE